MNTLAGTRYHYVFTFEAGVGYFGAPGGRMTFYRDGYQIGWRDVPFQPKDLNDVNNWLGRITSYNVCYTKLLRTTPWKWIVPGG